MSLSSIKKKLVKIQLIVSDIDGVLTNGKITMDDDHREIRNFHVQDGMGMKLAQEFGVDFVFISGRVSMASGKRLKDLGVRHVYQDIREKGVVLEKILAQRHLRREEVCAVGDDLPDLSLFDRAGVAVAVANAVEDVKSKAHWTTQHRGGDGALREIVDEIFKAKGLWSKVLARFSV